MRSPAGRDRYFETAGLPMRRRWTRTDTSPDIRASSATRSARRDFLAATHRIKRSRLRRSRKSGGMRFGRVSSSTKCADTSGWLVRKSARSCSDSSMRSHQNLTSHQEHSTSRRAARSFFLLEFLGATCFSSSRSPERSPSRRSCSGPATLPCECRDCRGCLAQAAPSPLFVDRTRQTTYRFFRRSSKTRTGDGGSDARLEIQIGYTPGVGSRDFGLRQFRAPPVAVPESH